MKYLTGVLFLCLSLATAGFADGAKSEKELMESLKGADAVQAMETANDWKWSQPEIKSHVTPREVVFEFSNGMIKRIPLPEEKMVVAVAPYINQTHR